jgi:phenylpropionate dioxygenase-like ring-hydroxylating dioxygenase large terminal subunit
MLLRNAWYIAAWADEIGGDQPLARRICNEPIVLFRGGTGRVGALTDRCCHRAAPLSMGSVVVEGIQCGYHGLVIDGSGRCVRIPGQKQIPADARVRSTPRSKKTRWCGSGWATRRRPMPPRSLTTPTTTTPANGPISMTSIQSRLTTC